MNPKNDHRTKNIYNSYTISEKLFYLSLIHKGLSQHEIERKYNVPTRTQRWKRRRIKKCNRENEKYRLPGGGKRPETD